MPTFYGDLQVIMFVLLHLYLCTYVLPGEVTSRLQFNMYFLYNYHASIRGIQYMYSSRQNWTYLIYIRVFTLYYVLNNLNIYLILLYTIILLCGTRTFYISVSWFMIHVH